MSTEDLEAPQDGHFDYTLQDEIDREIDYLQMKQLTSNQLDQKGRSPTNVKPNYQKRNEEKIKQLQEKNQRMVEEMERQKKREQDEREKLRREILEQAAKTREEKKRIVEMQGDDTNKDKRELPELKKRVSKKEQELANVYGKPTEPQTQNIEKEKINNYYRSRYASFLSSLQENLKAKKANEEAEKKRKEDILNKIRESMGINNVTSKLFDTEKNKENNLPKLDPIVPRGRDVSAKEPEDRNHSVENAQIQQGKLSMEAQQKLLERHKKLLAQISEKKRLEQQQEEEELQRRERAREKLKEKVLGKTTGPNFKEKKESPYETATIKGLNLAESTVSRKPKKKYLATSLPPIKDRKNEGDNDDDNDQDGDDGDDGDDDDDNGDDGDDDDEGDIYGNDENISPNKKSKKKKDKDQLPIYPNITDLPTWKKRHHLDPNTRVFIVIGGYGTLKKALKNRGWVENPDRRSCCFDLKWTLKAKDIDMNVLEEYQVVNHFERNASITAKVGLCKSLRNLIWHANVDIDTFYPRCYDLNDPNDLEDYIEDFKTVKAQSILKKYIIAANKKDPAISSMETLVQTAYNICERKIKDIEELLDDPKGITQQLITPEEWAILAADELTTEQLALKKHENWMNKVGGSITTSAEQKVAKPKKKAKSKKKAKADGEETKEEEEEEEDPFDNEFIQNIRKMLEKLAEKFPQFGINGTDNIWIVKPAGLSRGRGIVCMKNLVEILDYTKHAGQWVVQKYIENPLIIKKRKFDIRQWVLVTDWNPLTVWFYDECYVRFGAADYDTTKLDNKFIHLTNNSITKYCKEEAEEEIEGNMWTCHALEEHLNNLDPSRNIFQEKIKPDMKKIVIWALESVQDMIENKKNSVELYGYDFMIDEDFNSWLIEINSSPAMDYSTPVTERLVKMVLEDVIKVIVDHGMSKKKNKKDIDTGLFSCIHKSKQIVDKPLTSFGLDLVLEGKSIKKK